MRNRERIAEELARARARRERLDRKIEDLEKEYTETENAEILGLVHSYDFTPEQLAEFMEDARKQVNSELASYEQIAMVKLYPHEFEKTPKKSIKRFLYTVNS
jgi:archaellum component FlaC